MQVSFVLSDGKRRGAGEPLPGKMSLLALYDVNVTSECQPCSPTGEFCFQPESERRPHSVFLLFWSSTAHKTFIQLPRCSINKLGHV